MTLATVDTISSGFHVRGWVELLAPTAELAKTVAPTEFVPRAMRNNVPAITACVLYGDEVGIGPMQSLAHIAVIDGRPFMAAETQRALVLAAGHDLWPEDWTATRCTWAGRRAGRDQVTRVTWSLDDARRAGLHGKNNWRNYPRQMLSARASAELVRAVFSDVVGGIGALEEFDDLDVEQVGGDVAITGTPAPAKRRRRRTGSAAVVSATAPAVRAGSATPEGELPPLPDEGDAQAQLDAQNAEIHEQVEAANARLRELQAQRATDDENAPADMSTRAQRDRMHGLFRRRGITDRDARLAEASRVLGRNVTSSTALTAAEADALLDYLESTPETDEQQALDVEGDEVEPGDNGGSA